VTELDWRPVDLGPGVLAGYTARGGGRSRGDWAGLDLALHVGDDPEDVAANRASLAGVVGAPVTFGRQVHGVRAAVLPRDDEPEFDALRRDLGQATGGYDALVTARAGRALGVLVADCVPVLLADAEAGVVGTAHAGRPGLLAGVLESAVAALVEAGARADRVSAALGPSAGGCCYEVPEAMADDAAARLPATRARTRRGTPSMDLRAGCREALAVVGVTRVVDVGGCTIDDDSWFSYRRAPRTGRFAGVVRMLP